MYAVHLIVKYFGKARAQHRKQRKKPIFNTIKLASETCLYLHAMKGLMKFSVVYKTVREHRNMLPIVNCTISLNLFKSKC